MVDFELTEKEKAFSSNFVKYDLSKRLAIFDRLIELHKVEISHLFLHKNTFQDTARLLCICRDNIH